MVQKLTQMVGKNVKLYDMVLQFLRTLFLRTRNVHYCTLRAELLMSLHELDVGDICSVDPCHKVAPARPLPSGSSPSGSSPSLRLLPFRALAAHAHGSHPATSRVPAPTPPLPPRLRGT